MSAEALHAALDAHFSNQEQTMTEAEARELAKRDRDYRARKMRGRWVVWDDMADHVVEFEPLDPRREMNGPFAEND